MKVERWIFVTYSPQDEPVLGIAQSTREKAVEQSVGGLYAVLKNILPPDTEIPFFGSSDTYAWYPAEEFDSGDISCFYKNGCWVVDTPDGSIFGEVRKIVVDIEPDEIGCSAENENEILLDIMDGAEITVDADWLREKYQEYLGLENAIDVSGFSKTASVKTKKIFLMKALSDTEASKVRAKGNAAAEKAILQFSVLQKAAAASAGKRTNIKIEPSGGINFKRDALFAVCLNGKAYKENVTFDEAKNLIQELKHITAMCEPIRCRDCVH